MSLDGYIIALATILALVASIVTYLKWTDKIKAIFANIVLGVCVLMIVIFTIIFIQSNLSGQQTASNTSAIDQQTTSNSTIIRTDQQTIITSSTSEKIEKVFLNLKSANIGVWDTIDLIVETTPPNRQNELIWTSSDSSIVEVDNNGHVSAKKPGIVTIVVKTQDGKLSDNCKINVSDVIVLGNMEIRYDATTLDIRGKGINNLNDISPISKLKDLKTVYLMSNEIYDLTPLTSLQKLTRLSLHSNKITDISALVKLTNLEYLDLSENDIRDIDTLKGLVNIKHLFLKGCNITNINALNNMVNLESVSLESNNISDLSPLTYLRNIRELGLTDNYITDFSPLENITSLKMLNISGNNINNQTNLDPLLGLVNLEQLYIGGYLSQENKDKLNSSLPNCSIAY